jgi:hypothetical protein
MAAKVASSGHLAHVSQSPAERIYPQARIKATVALRKADGDWLSKIHSVIGLDKHNIVTYLLLNSARIKGQKCSSPFCDLNAGYSYPKAFGRGVICEYIFIGSKHKITSLISIIKPKY